MEEQHKECLRKNRMFLIDNVDYDDINDYLIQNKIIDTHSDQKISTKITRDKVLLPLCLAKGSYFSLIQKTVN